MGDSLKSCLCHRELADHWYNLCSFSRVLASRGLKSLIGLTSLISVTLWCLIAVHLIVTAMDV